jgi:hypothetical protein
MPSESRTQVAVRCPWCRQPLDHAALTTNPALACPNCSNVFEAVRFDPPPVTLLVAELATTGPEGGQPCGLHPRNAAIAGCERCGAFVCALCEVNADERALCPGCFDRLASEDLLPGIRSSFRNYPGLAGLTAGLGCLVYFFSIFFGPLAIYYAVKGLRQKDRMKESDAIVGLWAALILGILESLIGLFLIISIVVAMTGLL